VPDLLFHNLRPTRAQVRTALWAAALILVAFLVALPFRQIRLARIDAFTPIFDTALFLGDAITATLLLVQASVLRSKALLALGTGYFFISLLTIPHGLTFPWAFTPTGLLGAGIDTTTWLYHFWHLGLALSIMAYAYLRQPPDTLETNAKPLDKTILVCLVCAALLAAALTLLATAGASLLPRQMADPLNGYSGKVFAPGYFIMLLIAGAGAMTWRGQRTSLLDVWLMLLLWAWFLELFAVSFTPLRFAVGWYFGRVTGLLSGLFVMLMLLAETSKLYAQTALQARAQERERENRLMIRDAIALSIAHELRQPLAAIMLNAQAGQRALPKPDANISSILDAIVSDSHRASSVIDSTKALFEQSTTQKSPANLNRLVRDTLTIISRDLRQLDVSPDLRLDNSLPPIAVNRLQMQQALFNLFMNAAEAMSTTMDRPRLLTIQSSSGAEGLVIRVDDTGPGISADDQDRIFDAFFTTKSQGTGLGLSICRSVIEAHGGCLRAGSRQPVGATFEIYLPYSGKPAA